MSTLSVKQEMADEIGYVCPDNYNASRLLFDNLDEGRGSKVAVYSDAGSWTYDQLASDANKIANTLQSLGR